MARKELPEHLRKIGLRITTDPEVATTAQESGNASAWFNEAGKRYMRALLKKGKAERGPADNKEGEGNKLHSRTNKAS